MIKTRSLRPIQSAASTALLLLTQLGASALSASAQSEYSIDHIASWGGTVNAFVHTGNTGYCGSGERLVILDMTDLDNLVELGSVRLGSTVNDIAIRNGFAYVITRTPDGACWNQSEHGDTGRSLASLHVVDVSSPNAPDVVWSNPPLTPGNEWGCLGGGGGYIYKGREIDLFSTGNGDYAILRDDGDNITFADLSNPQAPVFINPRDVFFEMEGTAEDGYDGLGANFLEMAVQNSLLYVVSPKPYASLMSLHIYDLSEVNLSILPVTPPLVGTVILSNVDVNGFYTPLTIEGDWAYIGGIDQFPVIFGDDPVPAVWTVDCSDPATPIVTDKFDDFMLPGPGLGPVWDLSVSGGRLYMAARGALVPSSPYSADSGSGVLILDVATNPGQPVELGRYRTRGGDIFGVIADGDTFYLRNVGEGLIVLDATDPQNTSRRGGFHSPSVLSEIARQDELLYVSDRFNGFSILDVSNPAAPELIGVHQASDDGGLICRGITLDGDGYAYLGAGYAGLEIVDVSNPTNPVLAGAFRLSATNDRAGAIAIQMSGNNKIAYLGTVSRVLSLDVTDPANIVQLDSVPVPGLPWIMKPDGQGLIYLSRESSHNSAVHVLDVSVPTNVTASVVGDPSLSGALAIDLDSSRNLLSVTIAASSGDLEAPQLIDVSNPLSATAIGALAPLHNPGAIAHHPLGTLVAGWEPQTQGGSGHSRLMLFDTEDPAMPELVQSGFLPQRPAGYSELNTAILADETAVYLTFGARQGEQKNTGLLIFDVVRHTCQLADITCPSGGGPFGCGGQPDGQVDVFDLLELLNNWGTNGSGARIAAPLDVVDIFDLLALLSNWGPCE